MQKNEALTTTAKSTARKALLGCAVLAVLGLIAAWLLTPNGLPANALTMTPVHTGQDYGAVNTVTLTLSNATDTTIVFETDGRLPSFLISLEMRGGWTNTSPRTVGGGLFLLAPHEELTTQIDLPPNVRKAKFELSVTPLSPRTRLLFDLQNKAQWSPVRKLTRWSFALDEQKEREMSSDVLLIDSGSGGHFHQ